MEDTETMSIEEARAMTHAAIREEYAMERDMTPEEFFDRIEQARKQPGKKFDCVEDLDKYIRSL